MAPVAFAARSGRIRRVLRRGERRRRWSPEAATSPTRSPGKAARRSGTTPSSSWTIPEGAGESSADCPDAWVTASRPRTAMAWSASAGAMRIGTMPTHSASIGGPDGWSSRRCRPCHGRSRTPAAWLGTSCTSRAARKDPNRRAPDAAWAIDLGRPDPTWRTIDPCPGGGRILAVAASCDGAFWMAGGAGLAAGDDGKLVRHYRKDAYRYTAGSGWRRVADLPIPSRPHRRRPRPMTGVSPSSGAMMVRRSACLRGDIAGSEPGSSASISGPGRGPRPAKCPAPRDGPRGAPGDGTGRSRAGRPGPGSDPRRCGAGRRGPGSRSAMSMSLLPPVPTRTAWLVVALLMARRPAELPRPADARVDEVLRDGGHPRHRLGGELGLHARPVQVGVRRSSAPSAATSRTGSAGASPSAAACSCGRR